MIYLHIKKNENNALESLLKLCLTQKKNLKIN